MTYEERKEAIKVIKKTKKLEYASDLHKYTFREILCGILTGAGIAAYISLKATENIVNIESLPINGYLEEAGFWVREELLPKLRNFPELWETIKGNNGLEHFVAGLTSLLAATGIWQMIKKHNVKEEKRKATNEAIRSVGN